MSEESKIIIVDKNDNIIGYKERKTLINEKDIYRVSALWVTNSQEEILLAQRSFNKNNDPGKWGPAVAGTVEEGETYENNIYKEAEEELGIRGLKFDLGPKIDNLDKTNVKHLYFSQWFMVNLDRDIEDFKIQDDEVEQIKWFSVDEIFKIMKKNPNFFLLGITNWIKIFVK